MGSVGGNTAVVYIVRHGESMGNLVKKNLSPAEEVLTADGKIQAQKLGEFLRPVKFTKAYTSDYPRCIETSEILLRGTQSDVPLEQDARLREWYLGKYENGALLRDILMDFAGSGKNFMDWVPEGAETREERSRRAETFFEDLFQFIDTSEVENDIILVTTHGAFLLGTILNDLSTDKERYNLLNWNQETMFKVPRNTGYFQLAVQKNPVVKKPRVIEILTAHGNEHLKDMESDTMDKYTRTEASAQKYQGCIHQ